MAAHTKRRWLPSMWPPPPDVAQRLHLERCLRLLPHLADMGGFFVALLRKVAPLPGPSGARRPAAPNTAPSSTHCTAAPLSVPTGSIAPRRSLVPVGEGPLSDLSAHLGLKRSRLERLDGALLCASAAAPSISRVAMEVAQLFRFPAPIHDTAAVPGVALDDQLERPGLRGPQMTEAVPSGWRPRPLRVVAAGCPLARRSRRGNLHLTDRLNRSLPDPSQTAYPSQARARARPEALTPRYPAIQASSVRRWKAHVCSPPAQVALAGYGSRKIDPDLDPDSGPS